jgi:RNA polymerase primary sigma factor
MSIYAPSQLNSKDMESISLTPATEQLEFSPYPLDLFYFPVPSDKDLAKNFAIIRSDSETPEKKQEAEQNIILGNMGLLRYWAAKSVSDASINSFFDLVSQGYLGMKTAIEKFDPKRGAFSTYASWWIRDAIRHQEFTTARDVMIPIPIQRNAPRCLRVRERLLAENGQEPSPQVIAETTGLAVKDVCEVINAQKYLHFSSLDAPILHDGQEVSLHEAIPAETDSCFFQQEAEVERKEEIKKALESVLAPDEQNIIKWLYGLDGPRKSGEDIGAELGVTKQTIYNKRNIAMRKLRNSRKFQKLYRLYA